MANIHTLIVKYDSTSPREGSFPIDLNCGTPEVNKLITAGIYDMDFTPPKKVSNFTGSNNKVLTRIEDCDGSYILVEDSLGYVNSLVVSLCDVCVDMDGGNVLGNDCDKPVHTKDCERDVLIEKLQEQLDELVKIFSAVDGMELTTENIRIEAGQINLNTDELEQLITELNALVTLKGSDCANKVFTNICNFQELADAINAGGKDYTAVLDSIDGKLDDLALIKTELVTANTTLSNIKTDTSYINNNLLDIIGELEAQTMLLTDIKDQAVTGNVKLEDIKALLVTIDANILSIKDDLATIKTDIADIKTGVQSIDTKLDTVITSLSSIETKLDTLHDDLTTINTTLQTEFDQTQVKLDELKTAIEFAQDTFQLEDCDGNAIGTEQNVLKVIQLAKQIVSICNYQELADAINLGAKDYTDVLDKIKSYTFNSKESLQKLATGKRQDLFTWVAYAGETMDLAPIFTTVSMFVAKGCFVVENLSNNFLSDVTVSSGPIYSIIELASDGIGVQTGATDVPQSFDTRANSRDISDVLNSYKITCVSNGVIQLELYKD